ncbi:MAG: hypothetical protein IE921_02390 [Rhodobacteraceae bacterium]|nr:hypothetical protein [Paracoccaceae bacterium]
MSPGRAPFRARCFGLDWRSDFPLLHFDPVGETGSSPDITVEHVDHLPDRVLRKVSPHVYVGQHGLRILHENEASFDVLGGSRILCLPGTGWHGTLPPRFYGTVAALTLASRGALALHASSVVIDGCAWLIGGRPGAGKSLLTSELLGTGALFLADDLSVLRHSKGSPAQAQRGRPTMRLHPASADMLAVDAREPVPEDPRGKHLLRPAARADDRAYPLGGLIVAGGDCHRALDGAEVAVTLAAMVFRPRISARLPNAAERRRALLEVASALPGWRMPPLEGFDAQARTRRVRDALAAVEAMSGAA